MFCGTYLIASKHVWRGDHAIMPYSLFFCDLVYVSMLTPTAYGIFPNSRVDEICPSKAADYEVAFLVHSMLCFSTMHDGSWNANIRQMCPGYCIFNDNIIVLKSRKMRFSKFWIMRIRGRWRELKPIY